MTLFIMLIPLLLAVGINLVTPGINDTTVNVAMVKGENDAQATYFDQFAHVELLGDAQAVEERVMKRDSVVGVVLQGGADTILVQGNESESVVDYAKMIKTLYESDVRLEDARAEIVGFGRTIPPLKKMLVNVLLMMNTLFVGMLISLNIVEEKSDRTISAVNVTPTSRAAFILGKSLIGMVVALVSSAACLLITGFSGVNLGQAALVIFAATILSMMVGFVQGVGSSDVMEAAGSVKLMFLPLAGSVVGYELVKGSWQIAFYWSPFYWAYRANDMILAKSGTWPQLLLYVAIILAVCAVVYAAVSPRVRRGLQ
jgi:hypothetical protein